MSRSGRGRSFQRRGLASGFHSPLLSPSSGARGDLMCCGAVWVLFGSKESVHPAVLHKQAHALACLMPFDAIRCRTCVVHRHSHRLLVAWAGGWRFYEVSLIYVETSMFALATCVFSRRPFLHFPNCGCWEKNCGAFRFPNFAVDSTAAACLSYCPAFA